METSSGPLREVNAISIVVFSLIVAAGIITVGSRRRLGDELLYGKLNPYHKIRFFFF